jgi:hypothetical protein
MALLGALFVLIVAANCSLPPALTVAGEAEALVTLTTSGRGVALAVRVGGIGVVVAVRVGGAGVLVRVVVAVGV